MAVAPTVRVAAGNPIMAADTGLGWKGLWIEEVAQSRANARAEETIRSCWLYGPLSVSVSSGHSVVPTLPIKRSLSSKTRHVHLIHLLSGEAQNTSKAVAVGIAAIAKAPRRFTSNPS